MVDKLQVKLEIGYILYFLKEKEKSKTNTHSSFVGSKRR